MVVGNFSSSVLFAPGIIKSTFWSNACQRNRSFVGHRSCWIRCGSMMFRWFPNFVDWWQWSSYWRDHWNISWYCSWHGLFLDAASSRKAHELSPASSSYPPMNSPKSMLDLVTVKTNACAILWYKGVLSGTTNALQHYCCVHTNAQSYTALVYSIVMSVRYGNIQ